MINPYPSDPQRTHADSCGADSADDLRLDGATCQAQAARRRRRWLVGAVAALASALVLTAGAVSAYKLVGGSGVMMDRLVPADAAGFVEINLDPPTGQKAAAMRFLRHVSGLKAAVSSGNPTEDLLEPVLRSPEQRRRFTEDVQPWLGKHAAVAIEPQGSRTEAIVLLETTDTAKARAGLDKLAGDGHAGYVIAGRTAVVARTAAIAQAALDDARRGSLHDNGTFKQDVSLVGVDGVLTAWIDLAKAATMSDRRPTAVPAGARRGRLVAGLRFTAGTADLTVDAVGLPQIRVRTDRVEPQLAALPDDTGLAVGLSDADAIVRQIYTVATTGGGLGGKAASLGQRTGLLPDDLVALVGTSTAVAIGGTGGHVDYGLVSLTGDPRRAGTAATRLLAALGQDNHGVAVRTVPHGTVIASSSVYADRLADGGTLGDSALFRSTLPDLPDAQLAAYIDVRRLAQAGVPRPVLGGIRSFGLTASLRGTTATLRLRVVAD